MEQNRTIDHTESTQDSSSSFKLALRDPAFSANRFNERFGTQASNVIKWDQSPVEETSPYDLLQQDVLLPVAMVASLKTGDDRHVSINSRSDMMKMRASVLVIRTCWRLTRHFSRSRSGNHLLPTTGNVPERGNTEAITHHVKRQLRVCFHLIVAVRRLQSTLPALRENRDNALRLLSAESKRVHTNTRHGFRSVAFVVIFSNRLSLSLRHIHAEFAPLSEALTVLSFALKLDLHNSVNAGKCQALQQILGIVSAYLCILKSVLLDNTSHKDLMCCKRLPSCYYCLKELCRSLKQCRHYMQDCDINKPSLKVFPKLESPNTIKFILANLNTYLQFLAGNVENLVNEIDPSLSENYTTTSLNLSGKYLDHYFQLQAKEDLSNVLAKLKQSARPYWKDVTSWIQILTSDAKNKSLLQLLTARLESEQQSGSNDEISSLQHGLEVDRRNVRKIKLLGAGSYGQVFEVECFGERYAMKTVLCQEIENTREAIIQARLHHPNIVKLIWYTTNIDQKEEFESGETRQLCLLMELMDMGLDQYLQQRSHLKKPPLYKYPLLALHIMLQIAEAMKYLHGQGIMHRDLKASNVLIDLSSSPDFIRDGYFHIKLGDFGLAKVKEAGAHSSLNTAKVGTDYWRAPEVLSSTDDDDDVADYSLPADVYSFAMTCYEILTGKPPFASDEHRPAGLKKRVMLQGERPALPEEYVHGDLVQLIKQCWDGSPTNRPAFNRICEVLYIIKHELLFGEQGPMRS